MSDLPDYLKELEWLQPRFPREALQNAVARPVESVPHLLHALEWVAENADEANAGEQPYMLHMHALYLLAQFRETRAFPLIERLARHPDIEDLTEDLVTDGFDRILASTCGGQIELLKPLIEDPSVNQWVRGAAVNAIGVLLHTGGISRERASAYLGELLGGKLESEQAHVWDAAIAVCSDFAFQEHLEAIQAAYANGFADPEFGDLKAVEAVIAKPQGTSEFLRSGQYELINDTIGEMECWECFQDPEARDSDGQDAEQISPFPDLPDYLKNLEWKQPEFLQSAVKEAIARREESIPHLLCVLEWAAQCDELAELEDSGYRLHFVALFLLAQFRETRAFPFIEDMCRNMEPEGLLDDLSFDGLERILASTCGGEITDLQAMIEDPDLQEGPRLAAMDALRVLICTNSIPRAQVSAYFGELFAGKLDRERGAVWDLLVTHCAEFGMTEHMDAIRAAYKDGLVDPSFGNWKAMEKRLKQPPESDIAEDYDAQMVDDALADLEDWYSQSEGQSEDEIPSSGEAPKPVVREEPKVGRNDQCPCGSGKKYKKCCGQ